MAKLQPQSLSNSALLPYNMPISWSISPRKQNLLEAVGGPIQSVEKELIADLLNKINKSDIDLKQVQRECTMLSTSLHAIQKESTTLQTDRDRMMANAAKMNKDHEVLLNEVDYMKVKKRELLNRLEVKRDFLLQARRENTHTSNGDEGRRK